MLLELAGANVVDADRRGGARRAAKHRVRLAVVTDVAMPGRSGFWLVGQIRQLAARPTVPVLAVTGHPFPRDGMLRAGFDEQMLKPVATDRLYAGNSGSRSAAADGVAELSTRGRARHRGESTDSALQGNTG